MKNIFRKIAWRKKVLLWKLGLRSWRKDALSALDIYQDLTATEIIGICAPEMERRNLAADLACFGTRLTLFEEKIPNDPRPRNAINLARDPNATERQLDDAMDASNRAADDVLEKYPYHIYGPVSVAAAAAARGDVKEAYIYSEASYRYRGDHIIRKYLEGEK